MKKVIIISIVLSFIISLFIYKIYRVDNNVLDWQPYEVGDILLFASNKGEYDTIIVKSIETHIAEDDPLAIFSRKYETQYVLGKIKPLLSVKAGKVGNYEVSFDLILGKKYLRHPTMHLDLKEIFFLKQNIAFGKITKYAIVEAKEQADNMKKYPFDLRYIYWSKEYGYLRLEYKDNYIWTLKLFIRNNKVLYKG